MTSLLSRFIAAVRSCGLQPADRVAVALSGGPDSMALASMTVWWQSYVRNKQPPLALIVDHRLRPESTEEAHAVAEQAAALGMQTRVLSVEWPGGQVPATGNKQQAARDARYALLLRACGELGRSHLLLGHHAGDQAETFLLRLKHASGVAGLACMPRVAVKHTEFGSVRLLRPLLGFTKAELEGYCQRGGLEYVRDPTNAQLAYHRNRIRHLLEEMPWALPEPALALQPNGFDNSSGSSSSSGGSSGSSSSSSWEGAAGLFLDPSSSGGGGSARLAIADDLLRLQQRCEAAMQRQHALADQVLSLALVKTSSPQLHPLSRAAHQGWEEVVRSHEIQTVHRLHPTRALTLPTGTSPEQRERRRHHLDQQPWFIDWGQRLAQIGYQLRSLPYVLLDARFLRKEPEAVAVGALSRVLQAVAGTPYPPPLAQSIRLHQALRDGRLESVWTGGGCLARPLARSRGRYVLLVIEADIARVEQRLARLPPINAWEVARLQRHKEREREARAAAREARRAERKARAAECEAAGAAAAPAAEPAAAAAVEGG